LIIIPVLRVQAISTIKDDVSAIKDDNSAIKTDFKRWPGVFFIL